MENNLKKNIYWNTIGVTLNSFTSLFFLIIINRINGINVGGIFSFAFSLACLFFIIGIYATRTYQISDVEKKLNDSEYLLNKTMTCILMLVICLGYAFFENNPLKKYTIILFTIFKLIEAFSDTLYGYMQKEEKLYLAGISLTLKSTLSVFTFLIMDLITKNIVISAVVMVILCLIITLFFDGYHTRKCMHKEKIRWKNVFSLFVDGFPIFIISFLAVYIVNASKYSMNGILNDASQTIYGIIIMPATFINLCGQYIMNPLMNDMVDCLRKIDYKAFKKKVFVILKLLFVFFVLAEMAVYLLGIPVLNIVYAVDISKYKNDLLLILCGGFFYSVAIVFQNCLIIMHKNKFQIVIYVISSLFALLTSKFLILSFGIHGAVYVYFYTMLLHCITYTVYFWLTMHYLEKKKL